MPVALSFLFLVGTLLYLLPFLLNFYLAKTRGKNILLMLFLTIPFSYVITVILAYLPKAEKEEETSASGVLLTLFYVLLVVGVCTPMYRFMVSAVQ